MNRDGTSLGYRVILKGNTLERGRVVGRDMEWGTVGGIQIGSCAIKVPAGGVIQCFADYRGITQHYYWITDHELSQNVKRLSYETFDKDLTCLKDFLEKGSGKGNARDLESGVAWLLWIMGFSPAHLGGTAKTQEAADIIVTSPIGNFGVIECATGTLRAENKLPLLIMRSNALKDRLLKSGNSHLKVLPIIVTSRSKAEIAAGIKHAKDLGVFVVAQEELQEALNRTLVPTDADALFMEAYEATQSKIDATA